MRTVLHNGIGSHVQDMHALSKVEGLSKGRRWAVARWASVPSTSADPLEEEDSRMKKGTKKQMRTIEAYLSSADPLEEEDDMDRRYRT